MENNWGYEFASGYPKDRNQNKMNSRMFASNEEYLRERYEGDEIPLFGDLPYCSCKKPMKLTTPWTFGRPLIRMLGENSK